MTDSRMNFQDKAPKIPPRILCIGMPVRDLTFHASLAFPGAAPRRTPPHFDEICGGNALNARDRHRAARRPRLDLRADGRRPRNIEPLHLRQAGA